ncbi:MAG: TetR/AcrR family transcriptional regulator [Candidatus Thiodiazotropha sp.]
MGRPLNFDRDRAVENAMNEIWKNGMEVSSAKSLAECLGISRSSLYNSFGSREGLIREAFKRYSSQSPNQILEGIDSESEILPVINQLFRDVCRLRAADPDAKGCLAVNCIAELVGIDDSLGPDIEALIEQSILRFEKLLQQAVRNGEIEQEPDLREKALALQNLLIGINLIAKVVRSEEDLWAIARQTLSGLGLYRK